jgi:DNA-binding transcriptional LysR family regulator
MISVVPLSLASRFAGVYGLRIVEPPMPLPKVPLKQFWHRRMDNDPALGWLRSLIAGQLVGLDPREAPSYSYEARTVQA